MKADAEVFVPKVADQPAGHTAVTDATPRDREPLIPYQEVFSRLAKVFAAYDEDEDEDEDEDDGINCLMGLHSCSEGEEESSCDESDGSSLYGWHMKLRQHIEAPILAKPWKTSSILMRRAASPDGSTSAGDSDGESSCH